MADNQVHTGAFNAMCDQLSRLSGVPLEATVLAEVGKVLEQAVKNTKSASVAKIRARYEDFVPMGIDAYSPKRTRHYGNLVGSNLIYYRKNRYPNELWSRLQARRQQLIDRRRAARGLAKKSWWQLAEALGLRIEVSEYVPSAIATTGKDYNDTSVARVTNERGVSITITNAQPTANAIGGARALHVAIQGRLKYFSRSCELAVFAEMQKIARQYPGLKIDVTSTG